MCSSLIDHNAHDGVSTPRAFLFLTSIDARFIHATVHNPVAEVTPKFLYGLKKGFLYRCVEFLNVFRCER